jgi:adenylate kinase
MQNIKRFLQVGEGGLSAQPGVGKRTISFNVTELNVLATSIASSDSGTETAKSQLEVKTKETIIVKG